MKVGVIKPSLVDNFAHCRVFRVQLGCKQAHQERFFNQNSAQGCSGWGNRVWGTAQGVLDRGHQDRVAGNIVDIQAAR